MKTRYTLLLFFLVSVWTHSLSAMVCKDLFLQSKSLERLKTSSIIELTINTTSITIKDMARSGFLQTEGQIIPLVYMAHAEISPKGELEFRIDLLSDPAHLAPRSNLRGKDIFDTMLAYFGNRVRIIQGHWIYGSNLNSFRKNIRNGLSLEEAAVNTWTGRQAARYGFTQVKVFMYQENPNDWIINAEFSKP